MVVVGICWIMHKFSRMTEFEMLGAVELWICESIKLVMWSSEIHSY
jgi:hypothetical protein